jgi:hypothetical protein
MRLNRWARTGLQRGDLKTLAEVANLGIWSRPGPNRVYRLEDRGFLKRRNERLQVTLKGRAALWIKRYLR